MDFIGTKLVKAERQDHINIVEGEEKIEEGYKVTYPDGYVSWSPKAVFEKAYIPMERNTQLKTNEPSIGEKMVENFVRECYVSTVGNKCTVVRAVLQNGFEIVEASACVSPENYSEKIGADICMKKIYDKVWAYLGFMLQSAVHGFKQ